MRAVPHCWPRKVPSCVHGAGALRGGWKMGLEPAGEGPVCQSCAPRMASQCHLLGVVGLVSVHYCSTDITVSPSAFLVDPSWLCGSHCAADCFPHDVETTSCPPPLRANPSVGAWGLLLACFLLLVGGLGRLHCTAVRPQHTLTRATCGLVPVFICRLL